VQTLNGDTITLVADADESIYTKVGLAHYHIQKAMDMPRLVPRLLSDDPNVHCMNITQAMRSFHVRKNAERFEVLSQSPEMAHLRCPISMALMDLPVVTAGGHTYDFASYKSLRSSAYQRGVDGLDLSGAQCNLNRALWLMVNAFKEEYGLATTPVPPELLQGSWPPRVAGAPKAKARPAPARFQPQVSMAAISQMRPFPTLSELFKIDGFLDCITMAGLNMLLRYLTGDDRAHFAN
jgi:hypothetical protein